MPIADGLLLRPVAFTVNPYELYASFGVSAWKVYPGQQFPCCSVVHPAFLPAKQAPDPSIVSLEFDLLIPVLVVFVISEVVFATPWLKVALSGTPCLQRHVAPQDGAYQWCT